MKTNQAASPEISTSTCCPRNCYSTCSLRVRVADGRVCGIDAHPLNRATPEGGCIKGLAYVERANSKDRILYPLRKNASGQFIRINWDEVFDLLREKLSFYRETFGPHSVLFYAASGMSGLLNGVSTAFWKQFGGATTTYGNLCWPAGLEATRLTLGANNHNAPWDLEHARLVLLWGKNPAESNIQEMMHIDKSLEQGGRLIVIDPRRTPSADRAEKLFQIKPGTDGALALCLAREIIQRQWHDQDFIRQYVHGFEEFSAHIEKFTPEQVSQICRIPEKDILELAEYIGNTRPMTLIPGYGMQRYANGGQTIRCLLSLSVITGNIGKPGACWHYANLQSYIFDSVKEPESYYPGSEDARFRRKVSMARLGEDILALRNPEIKMIWVERGNPLTQNPDSGKNTEAFRKADFKVVIDQFMTDTASEADLILPAKNMFEQSDIIGSYWNPYVQLRQKVVEPAGEVKPETEIYYHLAKTLGWSDEIISSLIPVPGDAGTEAFLKKHLLEFPEIQWEELQKGPVLAACYEEIPFADGQFPTPSGKIELLSKQAADRWGISELPDYVPLKPATDGWPIQLLSPNSKNRIHSQFGNLQVIKQFEPEAILWVHPSDAEERELKPDDPAVLFNDRGNSKVRIGFDLGLRTGTAVLTNGHWHQVGASPNAFTDGRETDIGHGTAFHDTWVDFRRVGHE